MQNDRFKIFFKVLPRLQQRGPQNAPVEIIQRLEEFILNIFNKKTSFYKSYYTHRYRNPLNKNVAPKVRFSLKRKPPMRS